MANEEHLRIIKQGVDVWNRWRKTSSDFLELDLSEADLRGMNLNGADLSGTDLTAANLSGAELNANLYRASLIRSDLSRANLSGSSHPLVRLLDKPGLPEIMVESSNSANLRKANLYDANLREAILYAVDFSDAHLRGADLTKSIMGETNLLRLDLSLAIGLETVVHRAPSSLDIDTIYSSRGKIPDQFLRGVGIPDNFIDHMHSLVDAALEFHSCFISYSSKDQKFADQLHADLQARGVRCWFAPEHLKIGDRLRPSFDDAIRVHDKLMVLLSESSVESPWVEKEVETAFEKERQQNRVVLFPIRLDDAVMQTKQAWAADIRRTRHIGDFRGWRDHDSYKRAFERLLRDLREENKAASAAQT